MEDSVERAVERAIATMRDNLGDAVTIDDMARAALFSKFHFTRIFQRATGVSPGRFLSAVRLQQAKELLISTSLNVADISIQVGYNSVGTFSTRFTRSVGLSPTTYRRMGGYTLQIFAAPTTVPETASGIIAGHVMAPPTDRPGLIFVGLFPNRMPEGRPIRCTILDRPGPFVLDRVPRGLCYVLSHAVSATNLEDSIRQPFGREEGLCVGNYGPITVRRDTVFSSASVQLRAIRPLDPPVLLALLDVRKAALENVTTRTTAA
jgi:AraC family transcriptional regulator